MGLTQSPICARRILMFPWWSSQDSPNTEMAVSFMRDGVVDYLVKPVTGDRLKAAMAQAMEWRKMAWR